MRLVVYKSKKVLELWNDEKLQKTYPIGIGKEEKGHKQREGDMRTPEGEYVVCVKNPKSKFYLSLGLNYPNNADAKAGLERGAITEQEYRQIVELNDSGKIPLWKTALGGEIFIHGELEKKDWSEGCIRMFNQDIETLFTLVPVGTPVTIKP